MIHKCLLWRFRKQLVTGIICSHCHLIWMKVGILFSFSSLSIEFLTWFVLYCTMYLLLHYCILLLNKNQLPHFTLQTCVTVVVPVRKRSKPFILYTWTFMIHLTYAVAGFLFSFFSVPQFCCEGKLCTWFLCLCIEEHSASFYCTHASVVVNFLNWKLLSSGMWIHVVE